MDSNQLKEECNCEHCMNKERQIEQAGDHWRLIKLNLKAQQCKTRKKAIKYFPRLSKHHFYFVKT